MSFNTILYEVADGVATITMNRPDKLNAFNGAMLDEMSRALDEVYDRNEIRVLVITGAGRAFSPGADFSWFKMEEFAPVMRVKPRRVTHRLFDELEYLEKPVIAAIKPHPPIWAAAVSPDSFELMGRQGLRILSAPAITPPALMAESYRAYRHAWTAAGHPADRLEVPALHFVYAGASEARARHEPRDSAMWYFRTDRRRRRGAHGRVWVLRPGPAASRGGRLRRALSVRPAVR